MRAIASPGHAVLRLVFMSTQVEICSQVAATQRSSHGQEVVNPFGVEVEQQQREIEQIAELELTLVGHVRLERERAVAARQDQAGIDTEACPRKVERLVEQQGVVADVQVAVGVDELRTDRQ